LEPLRRLRSGEEVPKRVPDLFSSLPRREMPDSGKPNDPKIVDEIVQPIELKRK
jgi:hypothetical protein